eukprot:scaffold22589_cov138-Cylindrotheca_fusiformis.AAC.18
MHLVLRFLRFGENAGRKGAKALVVQESWPRTNCPVNVRLLLLSSGAGQSDVDRNLMIRGTEQADS